MLKRTSLIFLIFLLINLAFAPAAFAKSAGTNKEAKFIKKLQSNIQKQGIGVNSKIKLKLKDGTKLKGYISEINDNQFVVIEEKTGQNVSVSYNQVNQAKGNNWSQKQVIGLIAIAALITFVVVAVATAKD